MNYFVSISHVRHVRKRVHGRKLSRTRNLRRALLTQLAGSFFLHGRITTTAAKASELRPFAEKVISRSRKNTVANRRILRLRFPSRVVKRLLEEIGPKYQDRAGGYTRIVKLPPRKSDAAPQAIIELIEK